MQMNPSPCGDVSADDLIRMTRIRYVFLSCMLPRNPDYVIAGKREIRHHDARHGQKSVEFLGFRNYFSLRPVASLSQFPPHGGEAQLGQTPFCSIRLDGLFI